MKETYVGIDLYRIYYVNRYLNVVDGNFLNTVPFPAKILIIELKSNIFYAI